jgi:hypothetical protein
MCESRDDIYVLIVITSSDNSFEVACATAASKGEYETKVVDVNVLCCLVL